jgi:activating signal cointegrator complex subunit 1
MNKRVSISALHMARKSRNIQGGYRPPAPSGVSASSTTIQTETSASSSHLTQSSSTIQGVTSTQSNTTNTTFASHRANRRPRPRLTHFLCIPLADTPELRNQWKDSLVRFEELVRQNLRGSDIVPPGCVRPAGTMHLTLGVMSLNDGDVQRVGDFLQGAIDRAWYTANDAQTVKESSESKSGEDRRKEPITVHLTSLVAMTRPKTSVLFADPTDQSYRLRPFCEALKKEFEQAGFMEEEGRDLKLHATVLNTIYGKGVQKSRGSHPKKFDPTPLLAVCEEFEWLQMPIHKVAVCKMGAVSIHGADGEKVDEEYTVVREADLPK